MAADTLIDRIANEFEAFVRERFQISEDDPYFDPQVNLWEEGYVDSAGVIEMIDYIESTFALEIPKTMLFDPGFTSIMGIASRIASLVS